ncbi:MAG: hypothetical protein IJM46_10970 [Oscillospiraceae bacterium]|nr:hypothetical protein [Oscillospiraceae bacterium]
MRPNDPQPDADELAAMLDELMAQGTQHVNLTVGAQTRIQTVNSTECGPKGACAVPNFELNDEDPDAETPSDE